MSCPVQVGSKDDGNQLECEWCSEGLAVDCSVEKIEQEVKLPMGLNMHLGPMGQNPNQDTCLGLDPAEFQIEIHVQGPKPLMSWIWAEDLMYVRFVLYLFFHPFSHESYCQIEDRINPQAVQCVIPEVPTPLNHGHAGKLVLYLLVCLCPHIVNTKGW